MDVKIALGVTGCIAAYKAIEVMRGLQKTGISVQVVLTRSARSFVTPLTFEALSGQSVITDMFRSGRNVSIGHIRLAQEIRLLAVVPATANILGKFAHGIADDFLSTLYLSCPAPVLLAPAMNVEMWRHPAVRSSVDILRQRGHSFVEPEPGMLACGMEGEGRLAEVEVIVSRILADLQQDTSLVGRKVLITAGPTIEDIDPIRFLSNRSSGKMGYAFARAAHGRGAEVILISGPTALDPPPGIRFVPVRSAEEMKKAVIGFYPESDIVIKAAAVADYRPSQVAGDKIKKSGQPASLSLVPTDDILAQLGASKQKQVLIGFTAETQNLLESAREKMARKNLDIIVANDISSGVLGADSATVHVLTPDGGTITIENCSKLKIAHRILDLALRVPSMRGAGSH
jgi:phosphopantothenoylcysteine decarboxylase / phosphopantothenate---cysteine ligase